MALITLEHIIFKLFLQITINYPSFCALILLLTDVKIFDSAIDARTKGPIKSWKTTSFIMLLSKSQILCIIYLHRFSKSFRGNLIKRVFKDYITRLYARLNSEIVYLLSHAIALSTRLMQGIFFCRQYF